LLGGLPTEDQGIAMRLYCPHADGCAIRSPKDSYSPEGEVARSAFDGLALQDLAIKSSLGS